MGRSSKENRTERKNVRAWNLQRTAMRPKKINIETIHETRHISDSIRTVLISVANHIIHDKHYNFIKNMLHNAKNIMLSYNSNLTTLTYKGKSVIDLWKQYRRILLRVSLDGYPPIYEYVSTHKEIEDVEQNIKIVNSRT